MAQQNPLTMYQWKNRLLIIYDNTADNTKLEEQKSKYFLSEEEYAERDLLVFQLSDNTLQNVSEQLPKAISISNLKDYLSIKEGESFKVSLIGKDGGVKLQSEEVLSNQKLFATIDAMPMRRNEMRDH